MNGAQYRSYTHKSESPDSSHLYGESGFHGHHDGANAVLKEIQGIDSLPRIMENSIHRQIDGQQMWCEFFDDDWRQ